MACHRNPVHCVVPPNLLERMVRRGSERQREWAVRTLAADQRLRKARIANAKARGRGPREGPDALAAAAVAPPMPNRVIRDAQNGWEVAGIPIVRREGDSPTGDAVVDEAYDGLGDTFRFHLDVFGRESIDDENMPLRGVVHFGEEYDNAFWDGRRMAFGDGDQELFLRFTLSLDVIGHELGHGVIEDEAGLEYWGQTGALNEHCADVLGVLVKQYKLGQTADQADWLIGADIIGDEFDGVALRSMANPGTAFDDAVLGEDPQPAHWSGYVRTWEDEGGVHINSGIPNKAFHQVATTIGGHAWEAPGRIWYDALRHHQLRPTATFRQFARLTHEVAAHYFGRSSDEARAVVDGWDSVGIHWR